MKRIITIILSLLIMQMLPAAVSAGVDMGGKLQVLYSLTADTDNFDLNRLALRFNRALSETNGFRSEVQFRRISVIVNESEDGDIFLEHAYYYQKNVFANDELNIGYVLIDWHAGATTTIYGSLSEEFMALNSVGMKYTYNGDGFNIIGTIANAASRSKNNGEKTGYDLGVRGTIIPLEGLTLGAGICDDVDDNKTDNSSLKLIADAFYSREALVLYGEFISVEKTINGSSGESENGFHLEGSLKTTDKFTAYAGLTSADDLGSRDRYIIGGIYDLAAGTTLHGEFVDVEDGDWMFNLLINVLF